jgi:hypothetical protein
MIRVFQTLRTGGAGANGHVLIMDLTVPVSLIRCSVEKQKPIKPPDSIHSYPVLCAKNYIARMLGFFFFFFFFFYGPPVCEAGWYRLGLKNGPLTMGPELRKENDYSAICLISVSTVSMPKVSSNESGVPSSGHVFPISSTINFSWYAT